MVVEYGFRFNKDNFEQIDEKIKALKSCVEREVSEDKQIINYLIAIEGINGAYIGIGRDGHGATAIRSSIWPKNYGEVMRVIREVIEAYEIMGGLEMERIAMANLEKSKKDSAKTVKAG